MRLPVDTADNDDFRYIYLKVELNTLREERATILLTAPSSSQQFRSIGEKPVRTLKLTAAPRPLEFFSKQHHVTLVYERQVVNGGGGVRSSLANFSD